MSEIDTDKMTAQQRYDQLVQEALANPYDEPKMKGIAWHVLNILYKYIEPKSADKLMADLGITHDELLKRISCAIIYWNREIEI